MNKLIQHAILLIILLVCCGIILNKIWDSSLTEGFTPWSPDLLSKFRDYQKTTFTDTYQFDMEQLQEQASPQDVEHLLKTGSWPWSEETKRGYLDAISRSTLLQVLPDEALQNVMKIYNNSAMQQLLSWNTKEGDFLLNGVRFLPDNRDPQQNYPPLPDDVIRCDGERGMIHTQTGQLIPNAQLPNIIPGFQFDSKRGVCNPCVVFQDKPNYSCPFRLNVDGDDKPSEIWKRLWISKAT